MDNDRERAPGTLTPGPTCQVCGTETDSDEPLCKGCGSTVDTIVDTPLPPIPDGGLARAMPDWLRLGPHATADSAELLGPPPNEFASILSDEDIPVWLKRMAERHAAESAPPTPPTVTTEEAAPPVLEAAPAAPPAPAPMPERRVMVGAVPPRPITSAPPKIRRTRRRPPVKRRTALGVGVLAAAAALIVLAIVLFG